MNQNFQLANAFKETRQIDSCHPIDPNYPQYTQIPSPREVHINFQYEGVCAKIWGPKLHVRSMFGVSEYQIGQNSVFGDQNLEKRKIHYSDSLNYSVLQRGPISK